MITLYFNEFGYYIVGPKTLIVQKCVAATSIEGGKIFPPLHHLYGILCKALSEIKSTRDDIIVFNDSRVIDELNGIIDCFDEECQKFQTYIRRNVLPSILGIVFFRKRNVDEIIKEKQNENIGSPILIEQPEPDTKEKILNKFKESWFNHAK